MNHTTLYTIEWQKILQLNRTSGQLEEVYEERPQKSSDASNPEGIGACCDGADAFFISAKCTSIPLSNLLTEIWNNSSPWLLIYRYTPFCLSPGSWTEGIGACCDGADAFFSSCEAY